MEESVAVESSQRFSFVAENETGLIGCASGLAFKNDGNFSGWFQITDLFVAKDLRSQGIGEQLLAAIEAKAASIRANRIFLWTSGPKAIRFYERNSYEQFTEMENWYSDGSARVGLEKTL